MDFAAADADDEVTAGGEVKLLEAADFAVAAFAAKYLIVGSALRLLQALGDRGFDASAPGIAGEDKEFGAEPFGVLAEVFQFSLALNIPVGLAMIFAIRNYSLLVYFLSNSLYGMSRRKARGINSNFHKFYSPVMRIGPNLS